MQTNFDSKLFDFIYKNYPIEYWMHNNVQIYHFKLPFMGRQMQAIMIHDTRVVYIYIYIYMVGFKLHLV